MNENPIDNAPARPRRHRLRKALLWLAGILVVLFLVLQFALGSIVREVVVAAGPPLLGTDISVQSVHTRIFSGEVAIEGLVVGPPQGFDTNVFELASFRIDLDTASLLRSSEPIHIREILIDGPVVAYEIKGLGNTNLKALLDKLGASEKEEEKSKDEERPGRKVVIDSFRFTNGKVRVAVWDGKGATVPLPPVELSDIGKKSGGATGLEALGQVLRSVSVGTVKAAAEAVGDVAGDVADLVKDVGGAALDTAREIGGAAVDAVKGIGGALQSVFSSGDDKPAEGGEE